MNITFILIVAAVVAITIVAFKSVAKKEKQDAKSSLNLTPIKESADVVKEPKPIVKEPKVKKQPAKKKDITSGSGSGSGSGAGKATIGGAGKPAKPAKKSSGSGSGKK